MTYADAMKEAQYQSQLHQTEQFVGKVKGTELYYVSNSLCSIEHVAAFRNGKEL